MNITVVGHLLISSLCQQCLLRSMQYSGLTTKMGLFSLQCKQVYSILSTKNSFRWRSLHAYGSLKCTIFPLQVGFEAPTCNFTQVLLQSSCRDFDSKHTHLIMSFNSRDSWPMIIHTDQEMSFTTRNGGLMLMWPEDCFLSPLVQRKRVMAHLLPSKGFLKAKPRRAMLSQPSFETCPPPLFAGEEPRFQGHCQKRHHHWKVL